MDKIIIVSVIKHDFRRRRLRVVNLSDGLMRTTVTRRISASAFVAGFGGTFDAFVGVTVLNFAGACIMAAYNRIVGGVT